VIGIVGHAPNPAPSSEHSYVTVVASVAVQANVAAVCFVGFAGVAVKDVSGSVVSTRHV
jgi:hypothetical protein